MGLFSFLKPKDINAGVAQFLATPDAQLIAVRRAQEYAEGHNEGSRNLPLQDIERAEDLIKDKGTPLFVYCHSGSRSAAATRELLSMGYTNVNNIGGIASYHGRVITE